jgi:hypothetical protein
MWLWVQLSGTLRRFFIVGVLVGLVWVGTEANASAQEGLLVGRQPVPITPLANVRAVEGNGAGFQALASFTGNLTLPSGNVAGFGASIAAINSGQFDYVVVGAPDAGRAFVYKKANASSVFDSPVELLPSLGGRFGASVAIRWGMIAVGAPGVGRVVTFSQPLDSHAFPDESQNFVADRGPPSAQFTDASWGTVVAMSFGMDDPLLACGLSHCETFYEARPFGDLADVQWNPVGPSYQIDNGAESEIRALAGHGVDNTIKVYNGDPSTGYRSYSFSPSAVLSLPTGITSFSRGIGGSYDYFLVSGVPAPPGTGSPLYAVFGSPTSGWSISSSPVISSVFDNLVGTTVTNNTDTWLLSNTNAAGSTGASSGAVYRVKVNRANTFYDYSDDGWSAERLATGGNKLGAGLAMTPDFVTIGDPSIPQVFALANDQTLYRAMYSSQPTGAASVSMTVVYNSPAPTITEDPTCAAVPGSIFQGVGSGAPCIHVTPNAAMVGPAQVCFPNPSGSAKWRIVRCTAPLPGPSCAGPDDNLFEGKCCTQLFPTGGPNPLCSDTTHFSDVAVGPLADTDGDFIADVSDNCPTVFNPDQTDANHNGIGDACETVAVPAVPAVPPVALTVLAGLLGLSGGYIQRRRRVK